MRPVRNADAGAHKQKGEVGRMKKAILAGLLLLVGCDAGDQAPSLRARVAELERENTALKEMVPSEQPKVVGELKEATATIAVLRTELAAAKQALDKAHEQMPAELVPLASSFRDLKARVEQVEKTASRKGHTHDFKCKESWFTRTTEGDK